MNNLIVGINYKQDGQRVIDRMMYSATMCEELIEEISNGYAKICDEAYIVDTFDPANQDFINEIVTKSCRIFKTTS